MHGYVILPALYIKDTERVDDNQRGRASRIADRTPTSIAHLIQPPGSTSGVGGVKLNQTSKQNVSVG